MDLGATADAVNVSTGVACGSGARRPADSIHAGMGPIG